MNKWATERTFLRRGGFSRDLRSDKNDKNDGCYEPMCCNLLRCKSHSNSSQRSKTQIAYSVKSVRNVVSKITKI